MSSTTRLRFSLGLIVLSAMYAVTVVKDPVIASAIASGYVAIVLTGIIVLNLWKRP